MPLTGKEMLKLLAKHGWQVIRISGSHLILGKPGDPNTISVPVHRNKQLGRGLENAILKQAGLK